MAKFGAALLFLPSRPLAGRVDRVSEANAVGVGGLHLRRSSRQPPTPNPSPPRASRAGGGERRPA